MASQDVIELGSSDDEPEPVPKRAKPNIKPPLNAMVHIPANLSGVTIKKSKQLQGNGQSRPPQLPKSIRIETNKAPFRPVSIPVVSTNMKPNINPMSLMKTINNSQIQIKKIRTANNAPQAVPIRRIGNSSLKPQRSVLKTPMNISAKGIASLNQMVQTTNMLKRIYNSSIGPQPQTSTSISHLPPGITIKQVKQINNPVQAIPKRPIKRRPNPPTAVGEVLTVELDDDDDTSVSANSPQWYKRPEDQESGKSLEEQNNEEPDTPSFIEITIEDSPVKPAPTKRTQELAEDSAINIDESPVKGPEKDAQKEGENSGSDEDKSEQPRKSPNSKKKLQYSNEAPNDASGEACESTEAASSSPQTIEIEIPPVEVEVPQVNESNKRKVSEQDNNDVIEILESPAKKKRKQNAVKPTRIPATDKLPVTESIQSVPEDNVFHPIYQRFIDLCFKLENSEDMKKIVEKKIKTYYLQVPKEYTESEEFLEMVSSKIMTMKAGPEKMYLYIKDIVDELNLQRKLAKAQAEENEKAQEKAAVEFYGEELEADTKRKRQVRKLEKTLKKLNRAIHKLEEQEVDFDDDGDSVYILTESEDESGTASGKDKDKPETDKQVLLQRYKERLVRVHTKLCQLSNTKMPSEPRVHIEPRPGQPAGPAKRLEKWINKRVPVGTPLPFPDFHDVLRCVRDANDEDKLGWNEVDIMEEARDLFTRCGKKLQRRRQENEWRLAASRLTADADPADGSEDLKRKLEENRKVSAQRESELINKYADRQKQLQLEAVEIGDKEAEESPVESGDEAQEEERQEEESLESTEGRKERLKRLLKERSKGATKNAKPIELDNDEEENTVHKKTDNGESEALEKGKEDDATSNKSAVDDEMKVAVDDEMKVPDDVAGPRDNADPDNTNEKSVKDGPNQSGTNDDVHLLSDDSRDIGSEVDELNLLQKLHSGTDVATSTLESSDSDLTPIAISDTLGSSDDVQKVGSKHSSDIVSIENSSYSESETQEKEEQSMKEEVILEDSKSQTEVPLQTNLDSDKESPKKNRDSNDEYTEPLEDILLASSDDEDMNKDKQRDALSIDGDKDNSFVNLKDDSISIGDTIIEGSNELNNRSVANETDQVKVNAAEKQLAKTKCDEVSCETKVIKIDEESVQTSDEMVLESEPKDDVSVTEALEESNVDEVLEELNEPKSKAAVEEPVELQDDRTFHISNEEDKVVENTDELTNNDDTTECHNSKCDPVIESPSNQTTRNAVDESEFDTVLQESEGVKSYKDVEASDNSIEEVTEKSSPICSPKIYEINEKFEDAGQVTEDSGGCQGLSLGADCMVTDNEGGSVKMTDQVPIATEIKSMDVDPDYNSETNLENTIENGAMDTV